MAVFQQSVTVNVDPQEAYNYLSDISKHGEWAAHSLAVEKTSDAPNTVGSTFETVGHMMGTHKAQVKITELVPNQKIVYEAEDDTGRFRHQFLFQAAEGRTQITKTAEGLSTSLLLKLMTPLLPIMIPRGLSADLTKIKARLEG